MQKWFKKIINEKLYKNIGNSFMFLFPISFLNSCNTSDENISEPRPTVDTIVIQQMQFIPAEIKVRKGDTVVWINKGMVDHTVTAQKNKAFYSDTIHIGKSWKIAVADSAAYFCSIHPSMQGKLEIK